MYFRFYPKAHIAGNYTGFIFYVDASNFLAVNSEGYLNLCLLGVSNLASPGAGAISWTQHQCVEVQVTLGGGDVTLVEWRTGNTGVWNLGIWFDPITSVAWTTTQIGKDMDAFWTEISSTERDTGWLKFIQVIDSHPDETGAPSALSRIAVSTTAIDAIVRVEAVTNTLGFGGLSDTASLLLGSVSQGLKSPPLPGVYIIGAKNMTSGVKTLSAVAGAAFGYHNGTTWLSKTIRVTELRVRDKLATITGVTATNRLVVYGDSISAGYYATEPAVTSWVGLLRKNTSWSITNHSRGSLSLRDEYTRLGPEAMVAKLSAMCDGATKNCVLFALMTNDALGAQWPAGTFQAAYVDVLDRFHALRPDVTILCLGMYTLTVDTGMPAFRTAIQNALVGRPWATYVDGTTWTVAFQDGVHPNDTGSIAIANGIQAVLP